MFRAADKRKEIFQKYIPHVKTEILELRNAKLNLFLFERLLTQDMKFLHVILAANQVEIYRIENKWCQRHCGSEYLMQTYKVVW